MAERARQWDDVEVAAALQRLADDVDWPDPDVAPAVAARLRAGERRRLAVSRRRLVAIAAILIVAAAVIAGIPSTRSSVADWLGIGAVKITTSPQPLLPAPVGQQLRLGTQVTMTQARAGVDFAVHDPPAALGAPDAIYLGHPPASGQVAYVYSARPGLPPTSDPSVAVLVTQFRAQLQSGFFQKILGPDTTVRSVDVGGVEGFWIEGHPHAFFYSEGGSTTPEDLRLAGNTLLWERDGITFRLESGLAQADAVRIAASMR